MDLFSVSCHNKLNHIFRFECTHHRISLFICASEFAYEKHMWYYYMFDTTAASCLQNIVLRIIATHYYYFEIMIVPACQYRKYDDENKNRIISGPEVNQLS